MKALIQYPEASFDNFNPYRYPLESYTQTLHEDLYIYLLQFKIFRILQEWRVKRKLRKLGYND